MNNVGKIIAGTNIKQHFPFENNKQKEDIFPHNYSYSNDGLYSTKKKADQTPGSIPV